EVDIDNNRDLISTISGSEISPIAYSQALSGLISSCQTNPELTQTVKS
ncbi:17237_t:CDS:1, partial [Gigaspora rosea]